jgi:ATP-binding cassette subfamily B (MDR/TAP) protein 1
MTLIFGKLANSFIAFGNVLERIKAGDASAVALLPEAIAAFRRDAAANASYLVYTG